MYPTIQLPLRDEKITDHVVTSVQSISTRKLQRPVVVRFGGATEESDSVD